MSVNFDNFNSIISLFHHKSESLGNKPYLWKKINEEFVSLSWEEVRRSVDTIANGLLGLGILKGDRVVILSENRPEWQIADLAIMNGTIIRSINRLIKNGILIFKTINHQSSSVFGVR